LRYSSLTMSSTTRDAEQVTENTPLLQVQKDEAEKKLPTLQVVLLCTTRLFEGFSFFMIFPFISEMIHRVGGIDESRVGFYAGLIVRRLNLNVWKGSQTDDIFTLQESVFSLVQVFVMILWGKL
jgi:hypothetical protein